MNRFRYKAVSQQGQTFDGTVEGVGLRDAQRILRGRGLTPVSLEPEVTARQIPKGRSKPKDRALLVRQMATLLGGGLSLVDAVGSLATTQEKGDLAVALAELEKAIRRGVSFSEALRLHLGILPSYVHQLAEAGEASGSLGASLADAAQQMDYDERIRQDFRTALTYPLVLVLFGTSAVLFIFVTVVPRFAVMVEGSANVPLLSQMVVGTGLWVRDNLLGIGLVGSALAGGMYALLRRPEYRARALSLLVRVPVIGAWLREAETGRWSTMLAALLGNKVGLLRALELARGALILPVFKRQMLQVEKAVRAGTPLSRGIEEHTTLARTSASLIAVGEKSGKLPEMLRSLSELHMQAGQNRMKRVLALIEPLAIISVGVVIGTIVLGIVLAITSTYDIVI